MSENLCMHYTINVCIMVNLYSYFQLFTREKYIYKNKFMI